MKDLFFSLDFPRSFHTSYLKLTLTLTILNLIISSGVPMDDLCEVSIDYARPNLLK